MRYYSEETVKGILEQIDSHYVKELDGLPSVDIPDSSWQTGTPTEEGWYLFQFEDRFGFWFRMEYLDLDAIERLTEKNLLDDTVWRKIEPYKESAEEHIKASYRQITGKLQVSEVIE